MFLPRQSQHTLEVALQNKILKRQIQTHFIPQSAIDADTYMHRETLNKFMLNSSQYLV